jgi:hypothetical protein
MAGTLRLRKGISPLLVDWEPLHQSANPAAVPSFIEHFHGVEGVVAEILADQSQLLQDVVGHGDDMAADRICLENIEQLTRLAQISSVLGAAARRRTASAISGTGSTPLSATRPANTDT